MSLEVLRNDLLMYTNNLVREPIMVIDLRELSGLVINLAIGLSGIETLNGAGLESVFFPVSILSIEHTVMVTPLKLYLNLSSKDN